MQPSRTFRPGACHLSLPTSVISADFGYAGAGFRELSEVYGARIGQLELDHSSGEIEDYWMMEPRSFLKANVNANANGVWNANGLIPSCKFQGPLDTWCPNLRDFICTADAEWKWRSPNWIVLHVLLPTQAGSQFIGVRDMERWLVGEADKARRRHEHAQLANGGAAGNEEEDSYFMLPKQLGSLLKHKAFPSLLNVRDISAAIDVMRKLGRMGRLPFEPSMPSFSSLTSTVTFAAPTPSNTSPVKKLMFKPLQTQLNARSVADPYVTARFTREIWPPWLSEIGRLCHRRFPVPLHHHMVKK